MPFRAPSHLTNPLRRFSRRLVEMMGGCIGINSQAGQGATFDSITAVMSLLEGHADVMMDAVGPSIVPSVAEIRRGFDARRRSATGLARQVGRRGGERLGLGVPAHLTAGEGLGDDVTLPGLVGRGHTEVGRVGGLLEELRTEPVAEDAFGRCRAHDHAGAHGGGEPAVDDLDLGGVDLAGAGRRATLDLVQEAQP